MGVISGPSPWFVTTDPSTGTRVHRFHLSSSFNLSVYPAHNGRFVWLTRLTTQTVTPFDLVTQTFGSTISIGTNPAGIWVDDRYLWDIASTGVIRKVDLAVGTVIETISLPADVYIGLTGDKRFLWSMDLTTGSVIQIDPETGTIEGGFTKPADATDLHHDGRFLWIITGAAGVQGTIKQYDPSTGTQIGSFNITNYGLSDSPLGITGDGRFLYNTELIQ